MAKKKATTEDSIKEPKKPKTPKGVSVVYTLGRGSYWENNELRYSMRSVEKHLSNVRDIVIVGINPEWTQNVIHIPATDPYKFGASNILHKLIIACKNEQVSDNFLFINDDHFLMKDFDAAAFPYYYYGNLDSFVRRRGMDTYGRACFNSLQFLKSKKVFYPLYFDIHYPILINKAKFLQIFNEVKIEKNFGHIVKSIYGNFYDGKKEEMIDCKSPNAPKKEWACFSTNPNPGTLVRRWLFETFDKPSKYEI